jgi:hypothetical protein
MSSHQRLRLLRIGIIGAAVGLAIAMLITIIARRGTLPPLSRQALHDAEAAWKAAGVRNYSIEIEVRGAQPAIYAVEVKDGEPISGSRNGIPFTRRRSWETWSVPGMFETVASDVASLEEHSASLVVRCQFDPQFGYPAKYERIQMGTGLQVSWEVTKFERK